MNDWVLDHLPMSMWRRVAAAISVDSQEQDEGSNLKLMALISLAACLRDRGTDDGVLRLVEELLDTPPARCADLVGFDDVVLVTATLIHGWDAHQRLEQEVHDVVRGMAAAGGSLWDLDRALANWAGPHVERGKPIT